MTKRMTAYVLAPIIYRDCFKNVAGFAECIVRLENAIDADRKATLEAAADRLCLAICPSIAGSTDPFYKCNGCAKRDAILRDEELASDLICNIPGAAL
jgi:hypothetical protein